MEICNQERLDKMFKAGALTTKKKCMDKKTSDMWWGGKAFRAWAVSNFIEPESYDKIVSSNVKNVVGKMNK
jgi:hypothetical protein